MPSVGMRRTRMFGVVKGVDGARAARSGRCICLGNEESNIKREGENEEACVLDKKEADNDDDDYHGGKHGSDNLNNPSFDAYREAEPMDVGHCRDDSFVSVIKASFGAEGVMDKKFGLVYSRKRKRGGLESDSSGSEGNKFRVPFSRRQRRNWSGGFLQQRSLAVVESSRGETGFLWQDIPPVLGFSVRSATGNSDSFRSISFESLLVSVLSHLRKKTVSLPQLFEFLTSSPISRVCPSIGIQLLQDTPSSNSYGICKIFGSRQHIPVFSVDFSSIPLTFMYMHSTMFLRNNFMPATAVDNQVSGHSMGVLIAADERALAEGKASSPEVDNLDNNSLLHPAVRSSQLASRTAPYRNGLNYRSIQKRRSSLRSRRGRYSPVISTNRPNGSLVSDLISRRKSGIPFSSVVSDQLIESAQNTDSSCCSANLLVIEPDRCYREEEASVILEMSDSGEWVLAVKRDGLVRYSHKAQKVMRTSSSNRVTHDIIWMADGGWKLEFPRRQDWMVFKNLYKKCYDLNAPLSPTSKAIPVPGVREVSGYCDEYIHSFCRPVSYINMKDDEVSRTLAKRTASYDMDSEDEKWLDKFNNEYFGQNKVHEHLTMDNFELMIDAFEKASYCCPDDFFDEKATYFCSKLGQRDVVDAVYRYWMEKRKKRPLIRVFQVQQPKRVPVIPKPALCKKRSLKRQGSKSGSGKQPTLSRAILVEQNALEEQNALHRVEELKASAKRSMEVAILKRKRAQALMEKADLASYRATMALKIAEAAQYAESLDSADVLLD